jgi:hypothetical protein
MRIARGPRLIAFAILLAVLTLGPDRVAAGATPDGAFARPPAF